MTNLPQLRRDLAAAKAALRTAKDEADTAKAIATLDVTGKNDDERKRASAAALLSNTTYKLAVQYLRDCESEIDRIEAEVAIEEDRMRADELRVREKLADALLGRRDEDAIYDRVVTNYQPRPTHHMLKEEQLPEDDGFVDDWYKTS